MPIIPYTPFPTEGPRPAPPEGYQRIQTNPRQFGAQVGAAEERLGAGISHVGQFYGEVAADQATNNWQQETTKVLYGDPNVPGDRGFYGLKGQAAMDAMPRVSARIDQLRNEMRDSLTTPNSQLQFDQYTRRMQNYLNGEIGRHYDQQSDIWAGEQTKTQSELALNWITSHATDEDQVKHGTADLMNASIKQLKISAGPNPPADAVNATLLKARQMATAERVKALLPNNPGMAQQVFDDEHDLLSGMPGFDALANTVKAHATRVLGDEAFSRASGGGRGVAGSSGTPGAVIPYSPSSELLSGTGMSAGQYDTFRRYLAGRESSNYAEPPNQEGYMGRYQMGAGEIKDAAGRLGIPVPSQGEFLSNPGLQERLFDSYTLAHHNELMGNPKYASASPEQKASILAGAHLGGVGGVSRYLSSGRDPADRLGTHVSSYVNGMMMAQAGTTFSDVGGPGLPAAQKIPGIADAEAHYANTLANLNSDPALQGNPEAYQHALSKAEAQLRASTILAAAHERNRKLTADTAADTYVQQMMKPGTDLVALTEQIRTDPNLDKADRENLWKLSESHMVGDALSQQKKDGPGIADALRRVTADDTDPDRLTSSREVIQLGIPDATGQSALTPQGVTRVLQAIKEVRGSAGAVGIQKVQNGALAYAKHQLSFEADYGVYKVRDPKGEDAFNIGFTPAFFDYWSKGIAAGKTPQELASKTEIDKLVEPFKRNPAELMRDQQNAGPETPDNPAAARRAAADAYLRTHPELRGAYDQKYGPGSADAVLGPPQATAPIPR